MRIGKGFDVHAFGDGSFLTLGGVEIPFNRGFVAHSDGDVLLHALCDALLGACALGDIGQHFPDTDAQYKGISSLVLLDKVMQQVRLQGFKLANADLTIIAQQPKMLPHLPAMQQKIADCLGCNTHQINIKATTTEHLGFIGRKEGIAALASVLLLANS